ncbi:MAG TPA: cytochrome c maturation protein CcmE [Thiotrichaceae bacterium]|nr:cytochrome c maturation protein CcmE [Thiotrichaceae bacterium]
MKARQKRMFLVSVAIIAVGLSAALIVKSLRGNFNYYLTPTKVVMGEVDKGQLFRLGGMVVEGSLHRSTESLDVTFILTDYTNSVTVHYKGILPDLFKEKQSAVTKGKLGNDGLFYAEEVLAKHDPSYMPAEVKESLNMDDQGKIRTSEKSEIKQ